MRRSGGSVGLRLWLRCGHSWLPRIRGWRIEESKCLAGNLDIEHGQVVASFTGREDHKEVRVDGELADEKGKIHALEVEDDKLLIAARSASVAGNGLLPLLDDVGHALLPVSERVSLPLLRRPLRDDEKRGTLK